MNVVKNANVVLEAFRAIEQRDRLGLVAVLDPEFEISCPPSLPYGGTSRGLNPQRDAWSETWQPLQPTDAERAMDPHVVAASGNDIVILWRQRGVAGCGDHFDGEVLAMYTVKDGELMRAQMFYFDTVEVINFLKKAADCLTHSH
jgi:ketosteroid isomerase-like protein